MGGVHRLGQGGALRHAQWELLMNLKRLFLAALLAVSPFCVAPAWADTCSDYTNAAIRAAQHARSALCGYEGPRWSTDPNLHRSFCSGKEAYVLKEETDIRKGDLTFCEQIFVNKDGMVAVANPAAYAVAAAQDSARAEQMNCPGLVGAPLWSKSFDVHVGVYMNVAEPARVAAAAQLHNTRRASLAACKAAAAAPPVVVKQEPVEEKPVDEVVKVDPGNQCGSGDSTATVVIPEPNLKRLNIRNKPGGKIVGKVPEGRSVTVVGPCGSEAAAGIVAGKKKAGADGWCQIDRPKAGCVMAKYLQF